jgi:hypothetical protein
MSSIKISAFAILATTLSLGTADAQSLYTCGQGTVASVQTVTQMVGQPLKVITIDPFGEPQQLVERRPDEPRQAFVVTIRLFDVIYVGQAFAGEPENFDPTRLEKDERLSICVNGQQMILDRGDGHDFRAPLLRSESVRRPTGTR